LLLPPPVALAVFPSGAVQPLEEFSKAPLVMRQVTLLREARNAAEPSDSDDSSEDGPGRSLGSRDSRSAASEGFTESGSSPSPRPQQPSSRREQRGLLAESDASPSGESGTEGPPRPGPEASPGGPSARPAATPAYETEEMIKYQAGWKEPAPGEPPVMDVDEDLVSLSSASDHQPLGRGTLRLRSASAPVGRRPFKRPKGGMKRDPVQP
jgi:hypothetical protein